jgi:hypothetical protein
MPVTPDIIATLEAMGRCLPQAAGILGADLGPSFDHWSKTLGRKILPRLKAEFPLMVAICGGGSTGKSTLFNTLIGSPVSPTGGRAGLNRRVLIAIGRPGNGSKNRLDQLKEAFDAAPAILDRQEQLLVPGDPLYCHSDALPDHLVVMDTPDIDTGARGSYANRDMARQSLEMADLFIYIFTNATYNNLDNTDFIARLFTGMGARPCYLVYRAYPSFSDDDVREHAGLVAANIYGAEADVNVLGVYRADEDNAVAAGDAPLKLKPVSGDGHSLIAALERLDMPALRSRLMEGMIQEALDWGRQTKQALAGAASEMGAYRDALEHAQHQSVQLALSHFPTDRVLRRFAQIWLEHDPPHIKLMRQTGAAIQWPMTAIVKTVRYFKGSATSKPPPPAGDALERQVEMDLLTAANQLYHHTVGDGLPWENRQIEAPSVLLDHRRKLLQQPWEASLEAILSRKKTVLSWSAQLDEDLKQLADTLRSRMGVMDQVRQTFAALLNVIPATAAVTYILHTGDPVGAAGIKVKLTGLFGLHDLYALIAIPATAGMSKADRSQLEQLLAPLARTWLEHKFQTVRAIFEDHITGPIFSRLATAQEQISGLLQEIDAAEIDTGNLYKP